MPPRLQCPRKVNKTGNGKYCWQKSVFQVPAVGKLRIVLHQVSSVLVCGRFFLWEQQRRRQ
jgi:hypothetical protein